MKKLSRADKNKADRKSLEASAQRAKDRKRRKVGGLSAGGASHLRKILYRGGKPFTNEKKEKAARQHGRTKAEARFALDAEREFRGGKYSPEGEPDREEKKKKKKD